jgi:hypothetical protein
MKRPVLPIADSGGDAKDFYLMMLRHWDDLGWMGLSRKEFRRLGRPGVAGVHAAVELALEVGAAGPSA